MSMSNTLFFYFACAGLLLRMRRFYTGTVHAGARLLNRRHNILYGTYLYIIAEKIYLKVDRDMAENVFPEENKAKLLSQNLMLSTC